MELFRRATIKDDGGPGPGQYGTEHFASVGAKVSDSRKPQSASYSFGSSQRDAFAKTFTDRRTDRAGGRPNFATSNVQYHATEGLHSVGSARSPLRPRSPAFSMGRATRDSVGKAYLKGVRLARHAFAQRALFLYPLPHECLALRSKST